MKLHTLAPGVALYHGDCRDALRKLPDASIDSIVTDPPYALVSSPGGGSGFMGKDWDTGETAFSVEFWQECFRVLKPGGHVLAFSATRTQHRMVVAIEDAGFEIRDQIGWLYGCGFPKMGSDFISRKIDEAAGVERTVIGMAEGAMSGWNSDGTTKMVDRAITVATSDEAKKWSGWSTGLKPAWEPVCVARKPFKGSVFANVQQHGTGAMNIDGCRVGTDGGSVTHHGDRQNETVHAFGAGLGARGGVIERPEGLGRFPANIIHDGSDEVLAAFPSTAPSSSKPRRNNAHKSNAKISGDKAHITHGHDDNGGSAARFFYSAKATKADRMGSKHPTVKPLALMQYLCRLVTPPGGVVLDPFAGSGSTLIAAQREGFKAIGCEREAEYVRDIQMRFLI